MAFGNRTLKVYRSAVWLHGDLILDLMATDSSILGFSNRWYGPALENAQRVRLGERQIQVIAAPYFLATKLEAFHGRGNNDFSMSRDLEDIVTVIDGRSEIVNEIHVAAADFAEISQRGIWRLIIES